VALFSDPEEARRTQRGLLQHQIPQEELRLYESEEILRILSRVQHERSIVAKAVAALVADSAAKQRFLDNASTGGALWLVARTRHRADQLVQLLADYSYSSLRYYGDHGVTDVERDTDQQPTSSAMPAAVVDLELTRAVDGTLVLIEPAQSVFGAGPQYLVNRPRTQRRPPFRVLRRRWSGMGKWWHA
jgi:hypothetical protein